MLQTFLQLLTLLLLIFQNPHSLWWGWIQNRSKLDQSKKGFEIWPKRLIIFCCEEPDQQMWGVIQESSRRRLEATLVSFLIATCNFNTNTILIQHKYNAANTIKCTYKTQRSCLCTKLTEQNKYKTFHIAGYNFTAHDCLFSGNNPQMVPFQPSFIAEKRKQLLKRTRVLFVSCIMFSLFCFGWGE